MPGKVFVTGGSGFVGSAVIDELPTRGYDVVALSNRRNLDSRGGAVRVVTGDLSDNKALDEGIRGCDAVIHLVGIIMERPRKGITFQRIHFEGAKSVVDATVRNGVERYVHMSALGVRPEAVSTYHKTKFAAERYVRASGLDWTIFRPGLIHGPKGDFMRMEAAWARHKAPPFVCMPYFGAGLLGRGGAGMLQPVYVGDVARAFVDALEKPQTIGEVYLLGGPDRVTWPQLHRSVLNALERPVHRWTIQPIPAWYAKFVTHVAPPSLLPFNRDQVIMSQEDNTCDLTKFKDAFGWEPQPFEPTLKTYARQL